MAATLSLVPYDPAWPARFEAEAARLRSALHETPSIEHVGSTAIPGVPGKPVLDLAVGVASESAADECIKPLRELGYEYRGPYGDDPRRRYYVRDENAIRLAQIHLYVLPAVAWDEKLAFRDALRADAALAAAYATEKYRVANEVGWDKAEYAVAKGPFVERVLSTLRERGRLDSDTSAA
ncbi:MAG TPA: GrpB family protein [Longimicrobiales bacterium]|nr:GrpB family protein [Longimicrobiales bacterium]